VLASLGQEVGSSHHEHHKLQRYEANFQVCFKSPLEIRREQKLKFAKPFVWKCWGFMIGRESRNLSWIDMEKKLLKVRSVNTFVAISDMRVDVKHAFNDTRNEIAKLTKAVEEEWEDASAKDLVRKMVAGTEDLMDYALKAQPDCSEISAGTEEGASPLSAPVSAPSADPDSALVEHGERVGPCVDELLDAAQVEHEERIDPCVNDLLQISLEIMKLLKRLMPVHHKTHIDVFEILLRCITVLLSYRIQVPPFDRTEINWDTFREGVKSIIQLGSNLFSKVAQQWTCTSKKEIPAKLPILLYLDDTLAALSSMMELPETEVLTIFVDDFSSPNEGLQFLSHTSTMSMFYASLALAPEHLKNAITALKACYLQLEVKDEVFQRLVGRVAKSAMIFKGVILPHSKKYLTNIGDFFTTFFDLTFEQWHQGLDDYLEESTEADELGLYICEAYKEIRENFMRASDESTMLLKSMWKAVKDFEATAKLSNEEAAKAASEHNRQVMRYVWLRHFGALGVRLKKKFTNEQAAQVAEMKAIETEVFHTNQHKDAMRALKVVETTLVSSIDGFIQTMQTISQCFTGLQAQLRDFLKQQAATKNLDKKNRLITEATLKHKMDVYYGSLKSKAAKIRERITNALQVFGDVELQISCLHLNDQVEISLEAFRQQVEQGHEYVRQILDCDHFKDSGPEMRAIAGD